MAAIEGENWLQAGRIMGESHASLRRDYEVSCRELDLVVTAAETVPGIFGCRMTGGGFGGCVVALAEPARATVALEMLVERYRAATGSTASGFLTRAAGRSDSTPP